MPHLGINVRMTHWPLLQFKPVFRDYLWGGEKLARQLGKPAGPGRWAESWELVDHADAQSVVTGGPWDGWTLARLMKKHGPDIVGENVWQQINRPDIPSSLLGRFPLLIKFLDAAEDLSVQVHPDNRLAAELNPPDLGKTEAWFVLSADPGAKIFAGLVEGTTREQLSQAVAEGRTGELLHTFEPSRGDCIFVPAGTVHAIGGGNLILEVQQASNTTWRLHDWNRVDREGRSRDLHIDAALRATDFSRGPVSPSIPVQVSQPGCEQLANGEYFSIRRWRLDDPVRIGGDGRFHILVVTAGQVSVAGSMESGILGLGETRLLPAAAAAVILQGGSNSELIEITAGSLNSFQGSRPGTQ